MMKARTATRKTNAHVARWSLLKTGVRTTHRCPNCVDKAVYRTHDYRYFWCWTCSYECGTRPHVEYDVVSTDATSSSVTIPPTLQIIRDAIPGLSLQDALDVLRLLR